MSKHPEPIEFIIKGEPASKANSRRLVFNRRTGKSMFIKSGKAVQYAYDFKLLCPTPKVKFQGKVCVEIIIWYASHRPDLDESIILDGMQGRIYVNDRQVKRKIVTGRIDRTNPRAWIRVSSLESGDDAGGD